MVPLYQEYCNIQHSRHNRTATQNYLAHNQMLGWAEKEADYPSSTPLLLWLQEVDERTGNSLMLFTCPPIFLSPSQGLVQNHQWLLTLF